MGTPLYTIGHGPLPFDDLLRRLQSHGVRTVLDVRSQPHSSRVPQYGKAELEAELVAAGLSYRWLGHHLGGRPLRPDGVAPIDQPALAAPCCAPSSIQLTATGARRWRLTSRRRGSPSCTSWPMDHSTPISPRSAFSASPSNVCRGQDGQDSH